MWWRWRANHTCPATQQPFILFSGRPAHAWHRVSVGSRGTRMTVPRLRLSVSCSHRKRLTHVSTIDPVASGRTAVLYASVLPVYTSKCWNRCWKDRPGPHSCQQPSESTWQLGNHSSKLGTLLLRLCMPPVLARWRGRRTARQPRSPCSILLAHFPSHSEGITMADGLASALVHNTYVGWTSRLAPQALQP
ncbi:hypothetical protein BDW02DRAFT_429139 [Decorospora gaudefroyi]|uniref:Uncharacterized protein n=1 Tax=Decorospora gaudefroyi TaxID=184978 RepID=A0A6A5K6C9_9PLEO|nr:hypothetical protein BDW02DRAFT_429139 [Decorospora gaudefroyi]